MLENVFHLKKNLLNRLSLSIKSFLGKVFRSQIVFFYRTVGNDGAKNYASTPVKARKSCGNEDQSSIMLFSIAMLVFFLPKMMSTISSQ
jgi:hypothetical protein